MKSESSGATLCAVFVDYDNIYMSLRRKSEEAAKKFAKEAGRWLKEIENGGLVTANDPSSAPGQRRIVMSRCYGNPVPRRNSGDNSTDMNSFPFVRHHFLRAGFEVIDCPPLTAQLKNSADIRMVMDVRDVLNHETRFEEFIILSGDADFTPVLHRLRAHARRTAVFANDHTATPYTAISDGEVREADLISLLMNGQVAIGESKSAGELRAPLTAKDLEDIRRQIVDEVARSVRGAGQPVPLESLADRAVRAIGHDRTVGSGWGGSGGFRDLLAQSLPADIKITDSPPYYAFETTRQIATDIAARPDLRGLEPGQEVRVPLPTADLGLGQPQSAPAGLAAAHAGPPMSHHPVAPYGQTASGHRLEQRLAEPASSIGMPSAEGLPPMAAPARDGSEPMAPAEPRRERADATAIQQSIARIHEACQAPPLSPPEYRVLFEVMAQEINANNLAGAQTLVNIGRRAHEAGLEVRRDDIRFVLEVVSEADPWFEQGASANLFASRFRNFVVARCRSQGLTLTVEEIDLVDAWFGGSGQPGQSERSHPTAQAAAQVSASVQGGSFGAAAPAGYGGGQVQPAYAPHPQASQVPYGAPQGQHQHAPLPDADDDFPRIIKSGLRR